MKNFNTTIDEEVRRQIELELKAELDYDSNISDAKAEGKAEVILAMYQNNTSPEEISKLTNLPLSEINEILGI